MMKNKAGKKVVKGAKGKEKAKKAKRKIRVKEMDMAKVRQDVANIIGSGAKEIAVAVVGEAKKGQLATTKYLFEMAGVFPTPGEAAVSEEGDGEESLAKILVEKLKAVEEPKAAEPDWDEDEEGDEGEGEGEVKKDPVLVV